MKNPSSLILTDTHLSESNIEVVKSIFRQAIVKAKELDLKRIFHLGDIFHSRKGQPQEVLSVFDDILDEIAEAGLILVVIPGNHDKADYASWKSFLKQYRHHPAIELIMHHGGYPIAEGIVLHLLPFFEDEVYLNELNELIEHGSFNVKNVLGTHIGISGAVMNNGTPVESSITPNHFKKFDLVLVGHYHDPQELADGKIKYIGSSLQHNFGETTAKGAVILYDDLTTEVVELDFPRYKTFEVEVNNLTLKDVEELKQEKDQTGDFYRVIITGKEKDIKSFNRQNLIDIGIKVETKEDKISKEELESRIEPFDATAIKDEFNAFCIKNDLSVEAGLQYLNKVLA